MVGVMPDVSITVPLCPEVNTCEVDGMVRSLDPGESIERIDTTSDLMPGYYRVIAQVFTDIEQSANVIEFAG